MQQQRNEIGDLQSRVDAIRGQQQALKERLAPVLENRRAIERLFLELDTSQNDVERALAEIASGDDATALDLRLKKLTEFVRQCHERCDGIETASKTVASLKEAYAELHTRLAPFAAAKGGVTDRVKELSEARDVLAADIDTLQRTPQGPLAERVKGFVDDKARLDDGVAQLNAQFSKLATLHDDIDGLMEKLENALGIIAPDADGKADIDARIKDVSTFVATTQEDLEDIEGRLAVFGQLKGKLGELQSRLVPLEAGDSGVLSLVAQVQDIRDKLAAAHRAPRSGRGRRPRRARKNLHRRKTRARRAGVGGHRPLFEIGDGAQGPRRPVREAEQRRQYVELNVPHMIWPHGGIAAAESPCGWAGRGAKSRKITTCIGPALSPRTDSSGRSA